MSAGPLGPFSDDEIDHFETHGYVWLRGGLDSGKAIEWRDRITRLIRTDPSVIQHLSPRRHANRLSAFDPVAPRTWRWQEIRASTGAESPIREFAPRIGAAAAQLLGGEDRIAPQEWKDLIVINLGRCSYWRRRLRALRARVPVRGWHNGWHCDDPRKRAPIDSFRMGLTVFVALSDSLPMGGGTLFSPRSFPRVVRHVKNHPEGADMSNRALRRMGEWFGEEMVARTGDVLLTHPFVLHCRGPNQSMTARYMARQNFFLKEPMRFTRPEGDYSPVERAVVRLL